jgi:NAD(P)-dependent dehydrogenase (short-subunit alcohol dehydrogenase family)
MGAAMGRLTGKVAIVTGAASRAPGVGNGAATALLFAREGAKVVLVNRSVARAKSLEDQIRSEGGEAPAFGADVTQPEAMEAMAAFAVERYGRLDILHNNVGITIPGTPETVDLAEWNLVLQTNLTSALLCCRSCIPKMRAGGGGSIINVSSVAGMVGLAGSKGAVAYVATKAALQGLTLSIAADYAAERIRANCLIVGTVATPLAGTLGEEARERRRKSVPLQTEGTRWTPPTQRFFWRATKRGG